MRPRELGPLSHSVLSRLPLAGGPVGFAYADRVVPGSSTPGTLTLPVSCLEADPARYGRTLRALTSPRPAFAGILLNRVRIMGVVNVTPDSFSDGGRYFPPERAIAHGLALVAAGADIIDIGGESTRPGAEPVTSSEEIRRIVPVIEALHRAGATISVDTRNLETMAVASAAGATILNDVSALSSSPESAQMAAQLGMAVVLMHMRGNPQSMQRRTRYVHAPCDVFAFLASAIRRATNAGIPCSQIVVDPGLGFGKNVSHNLELLAWLPMFHCLGCGILVGASRKSMIEHLDPGSPPDRRLAGSLTITVLAAGQGANMVRVHDVAETRQALRVWESMATAPADDPVLPTNEQISQRSETRVRSRG